MTDPLRERLEIAAWTQETLQILWTADGGMILGARIQPIAVEDDATGCWLIARDLAPETPRSDAPDLRIRLDRIRNLPSPDKSQPLE